MTQPWRCQFSKERVLAQLSPLSKQHLQRGQLKKATSSLPRHWCCRSRSIQQTALDSSIIYYQRLMAQSEPALVQRGCLAHAAEDTGGLLKWIFIPWKAPACSVGLLWIYEFLQATSDKIRCRASCISFHHLWALLPKRRQQQQQQQRILGVSSSSTGQFQF